MQIKELILDGFKSYAVKTSVSGFDKCFNAITGLNGSGKSNILDAICFVMGIGQLSQMRVNNLNELIYKNGKAGIKKASVSLKLTNIPNENPLGIEDDEIEVTRSIMDGKSKYYINGITVTLDKVKSLFLSANLNINNPHFLIMQGKVTQVVNTPASGILKLIEEACGTGVYETKKESSIKTIKKKDNKLEEIERYLNDVITPRLEDIIVEKKNYQKWKDQDHKIRRMFKVITAFKYYNLTNQIANEKDERKRLEALLKDLKTTLKDQQSKAASLTLKIQNLRDLTNNSTNKEVKVLEDQISSQANIIKIAEQTKKTIKNNIDKSFEDKQLLEAKLNATVNDIAVLAKKKTILDNDLSLLESEIDKKKMFLDQIEQQYQANINNKNSSGMMINNLKQLQSECDNKIKKTGIEINNIKSINDTLNNNIKRCDDEIQLMHSTVKQNKKLTETHQEQKQSLEKDLQHFIKQKGNLDKLKSLRMEVEGKMREIENNITSCNSRVEDIYKQNRLLLLNYTDPERGFNRETKVLGRIIMLFSLSDQKYSKALDRVAGMKLFNVVVDSNSTSSILLERKCFKSFETFLPLDKIVYPEVDYDKHKAILTEFDGDAVLCKDVITYDKKLDTCMRYIFGNTYICSSTSTAKKLAYDPKYKVKCITLDGDSYDPSGTLTGGWGGNFASNIITAMSLKDQLNQIKALQKEHDLRHSELGQLYELSSKIEGITSRIEKLERELEACDEQTQKTKIAVMEKHKSSIKDEIKVNLDRISDLESRINTLKSEMDQLKIDETNIKNGKNADQIMTSKISQLKNDLKDQEIRYEKINKEKFKLTSQIDGLNNEKTSIKQNLEQEAKSALQLKSELDDHLNQLEGSKDKLKSLERKLTDLKDQESQQIREINNFITEKEGIEKESSQLNEQIEDASKDISDLERLKKDSVHQINQLNREHDWIESEQHLFNIPDSDYDFTNLNIEKATEEYRELKDENKLFEKKVNMKVDMIADDFEKQYTKLNEKRKILKDDKDKINKTILELDKKRKESLDEVYVFVNEKFNAIYSTFLPGASTKLVIPEGKTLLDGLEMKVGFNGTWKNSLSELSGGQRSLLALSFILSLLCFKPAPFYILDEIDAALDLSHTSNLGVMIKDHFPQSQFIIISLKDGMFNNANVLYQVSFQEGSSRVNRIVKELKSSSGLLKKGR